MQKKKIYIFSLLRNFFRQKNHCFKKKAWAFFAPFLYTVFGFFLFLFNRLFPERNQEKECTAEKFISFLSFSFFFLPPPFFVFFFPSHFLLKLLWLFFLLSFSRSHFSRKLLFGFKCRRGIVSPFDVTSGQAEVRVAFWSDGGGSIANYIAKDQFDLNSCTSDAFVNCINSLRKNKYK